MENEKDCEDGSCKVDPYEKVSKAIHGIYNPAQLNPLNHAYASSPRRMDEVKIVIKRFVGEWLTGKYQRAMEE